MSAILSCREATRLASAAIDRPLVFRERMALRVHLAMCVACRSYRRQIRIIDRLVRGRLAKAADDDGEIQLDAEARRRIAAALRRQQDIT